MGEVELPIEIGPVTFSVKFQVLQISSAYNFLLGRPWIHTAGSVPSSLHQKIRFIIGGSIITIFAEDESAIYKAPAIPFIERAEPSSYQTLEYVTAIQGELVTPEWSVNAEMIAKYFHRRGFQPGKGLGAALNGETKPREVFTQQGTFGLGYQPSARDKKEAARKRRVS